MPAFLQQPQTLRDLPGRLRETPAPEDGFWQGWTFDQQAAAQGATRPCSLDDLLGGWPEEEKDDQFEEAVAHWRKEDARATGDL
jgi:hypothetical protein